MALDNIAPRDDNRVTVLMGTDINTVTTTRLPVIVGVDALTHRLLVSAVITSGGSGGGTVNNGNSIDVFPATQTITTRDIASTTSTTNANTQSVRTGTPTAGSVAVFALAGYDTVSIQTTGTWTGTLLVEGSFDGGITYYQKAVKQIGTAYVVNSLTGNFGGVVNTASLTHIAIRSTTAWTGSAVITVAESPNVHSIYVANNIKLADGITQSTTATIKPASTSPVVTDSALVVSMSPNSINNTLNAELGDFTGTITNATQTTPVVATGLAGYDNVFISINGTYTGATAIFQGSDDGGTTWYNTTVAARVDSAVIEGGYTNLSSVTRGWNLNIQGFDSVRVNPSAVATGTVNVRISAESAPTNAGATVQVASLGDGTNAVNVLKSDGTAAGQNAELVAGAYMEKAGLSTASTTNNDLQTSIDVSGYKFASLQVLGTWTGTVTVQVSNDNTTFVTQNILTPNSPTAVSTITANGQWIFTISSRYVRIRVTTGGSGTVQGVLELYTVSPALGQVGVNTFNGSATGAAFPANAFPIGVSDGTNLTTLRTNLSDSAANSAVLGTSAMLFNNTNYDRGRNNTTAALIAAGTTTTQTGITVTTYNANAVTLLVNIASGAGTVAVAVNETSVSGYSSNQLTSTALVGAGTTALRIFRGATPSANLVANDMIGRTISVTATVVGTISYGIDINLGVG